MGSKIYVPGIQKFVAADLARIAPWWHWRGDCDRYLKEMEEVNIPAATLVISELGQHKTSSETWEGLGKKAEVNLYHVFALLSKQSRGQAGSLSVVTAINSVFFVRGIDRRVYPILAHYHAGVGLEYWDVGVFLPDKVLCSEYQVVSLE